MKKFTAIIPPAPPKRGTKNDLDWAKAQRAHVAAVMRHEQRIDEGIVGECVLCTINVYDGAVQRPSKTAMPCGLSGCPSMPGKARPRNSNVLAHLICQRY
jgi:hypothetical protein